MSTQDIERKIKLLREMQRMAGEAQAEAEALKDEIKAYMGDSEELTAGEYKSEKLIVLGPLPARVPRVNKKYRYRLIIKCRNTKGFRSMISEILKDFYGDSKFSDVSVYADMNPEITV